MAAKRKWIAAALVITLVSMAAMVGLAVYLVKLFKPYGHYEGYWEGDFYITVIEGEEAGNHDFLLEGGVPVLVEIDEQSRGYGHLALAFQEEEFPSSSIEPVSIEPVMFKPGSLTFDPASKVAGTLNLSEEKGFATLTGSLVITRGDLQLTGDLVVRESETGTPLLGF